MYNVSLIIDNKIIDKFISYKIESDIFNAADVFSFELASTKEKITAGSQCKLYINDQLELNGIIDRVTENITKDAKNLKIEGRDLQGLLVDSFVEDFKTRENISLKELANDLLKNVPFINRKSIFYASSSINEKFEIVQISPQETVFSVLKKFATARNLIFYCRSDGTLVFGKIKQKANAQFFLNKNNILERERVNDISKQYSKIIVIGQNQDADDIEDINSYATLVDKDFSFYKPFVIQNEDDVIKPEEFAKHILNKQKFEAFTLNYKVPFHAQDNKNYQINSVANVQDDLLDIDDNFLIYSRSFEMSRAGVFTNLKLSQLGVLPE